MAEDDWPISEDGAESAKASRLDAAGLRRVEAFGSGHEDGRVHRSQFEDARDEQESEPISELAAHIARCISRASDHRKSHGVDEAIEAAQAAVDGRYSDDDVEAFPDGCDIYRNVTGLLCRSAVAWLNDVYAEAMDRPWTIEATPVPALPDHIKARLANSILIVALENGSADEKLVESLRQTAQQQAQDEAAAANALMQRRIEDQLEEGGWRVAWSKFIPQLVKNPCACLKGPKIERRKRLKWDGSNLVTSDEAIMCVEAVDASNLFPSPDSTNPQDGEFIIERMRVTRAKLVACRKMQSFSSAAIALVLAGEAEPTDPLGDDQAAQRANDVDLDGQGSAAERDIFTVYDYWGRVSGELFLSWLEEEAASDLAKDADGMVETEWGIIDPLADYEINAWLCNDTILRAIINPHPLNRRPFHVASCYPRDGSFWGDGIPAIVADTQRELNAAIRARVRNLAFASGPVTEIDVDRIQDEDHNIEPWRVYPTRSRGEEKTPAIKFHLAPSMVGELTALAAELWQKAHDLAGIPPYTRGSNDGAAKTLGAFSLQYAGALKGIKQIVGSIDVYAIEPLIEAFWTYNMLFADDPAIKADAQIKARGAKGLIALEHRQSRPLETMQAIGPVLEKVAPQALPVLAGEFMKAIGYDPAMFGLSGGTAESELKNVLAGQPPQMGAGGVPRVDGRSGPAQAAMQGSVIPGAPPTV